MFKFDKAFSLFMTRRFCPKPHLHILWLYRVAIVLPAALCGVPGLGQQLFFQSFTTSHGLTQNSVYCAAETAEGFMWFGTQDGLNRFDGKSFMRVNAPVTHGKPASSKMITALHTDRRGFLWVGTTSEILLYDPVLNHYQPPASRFNHFAIAEDAYITGITEDPNEKIWITTQSDGLFCYDKRRQQMTDLEWQNGTAPDKIISVCIAPNENIIAAGEKDIYRYVNGVFIPFGLNSQLHLPQKATITECKIIRDKLWLILNASKIILVDTAMDYRVKYTAFDKVYSAAHLLQEPRIIHQSDSNTVWIGSRSDGLLKINMENKVVEHSEAAGNHNYLKSRFILSLYTTRNHITWVGLSGGGVAQYDPQSIKFGLWRSEEKAGGRSDDNMLFSIFSGNDEDFYAGTLYGGLMQRNIKTGYCRYFQPPLNNLTATGSRNIYQVIAGDKDLLWMATWAGLYSFNKTTKKFKQYFQPTDKQTRELYAVIRLKTGNRLLTGGQAGGLRLFNPATLHWESCPDTAGFLSRHLLRVRYMEETNSGDVLMSTEKLNLVKYNYLSGSFTIYPQLQEVSATSRHFVLSDPYIWIATDDGLVQALAASMQVVKIWNTRNGLPDDYIYAVAADSRKQIWVSSNAGIARLDPTTGICEKFTGEDGLQAMEFNTAACYKDRKGRLWFGGINGMNMIDPEQILTQRDMLPPLITNITVMNKPYIADTATPYIHAITLPYNQNFVGFEFQSPGNAHSEKISYEYMLTGVDTGWIKSGNRNYVNYTQLDPGSYQMNIRASNNAGLRGSISTTLALIITRPWFESWWFYLLIAATIIVTVYALMQYKIRQVKKMEWLRQHISANLHDDIGASLSSIHILSQLSQKTSDATTRNKYLKQINEQTSEVIAALRDIVWSINPKNDKIDIIIGRMKRYASELLEAQNIDFAFETNTRPNDEIADANTRQHLYLIFKEAVNNLAKYSGAQKAVIKLYKEFNTITLEVSDNGRGFHPELINRGNGIDNMERRAKTGKGDFQVISAPGKGVCIKVSLRL
ncbi:MAG: histidine kinase [Chitinophagaceae bacterium]|nr:histidine kinase [Chitinophagaceae bacterium]